MSERQTPLGDELFGTPMGATSVKSDMSTGAAGTGPAGVEPAEGDLDRIQVESEGQQLPDQEKQFRIASRVRSKLNNLPDPTRPPLGYVPGKGFGAVFPFIKLPDLAPNLNGDWVQFGSPELEPNRLYYGDNLQVLRTLPSNSIDLIYIDPPFFSGANYNVIWGDANEVRTFSDIWEGGLDTYLVWLNARLWEMRRVLKDTGSVYVHCDWHASHYIKTEMDKIFGYERFQNSIAWQRSLPHGNTDNRFGQAQDTILVYNKTKEHRWNPPFAPHREEYLKSFYRFTEADGRVYRLISCINPNPNRPNLEYEWNGVRRVWKFTRDRMQRMHNDGLLVYSKNGVPSYKGYLNQMRGTPLQDIWADISPVMGSSTERIGYPTQKPEALLARIINASSDPCDVVADFFSGGGVLPTVAQRLGRRWIACDSSRVAVSVTLNRLVQVGETISGVKSNYGKRGQVQGTLDLPSPDAQVPDIRVHYVGVYPMDRFAAVDQPVFNEFVLKCLSAQADASESAITGWRSAREPLLVGPAHPERSPEPKDVQAFFDACIRQLQPNVKLTARVVCWRVSPELEAYRKRLSDYARRNLEPRGVSLDLDFLFIDSEAFRERIRAKYPDADDNEFLLRFTKEPIVGDIRATRIGPRKYRFEAVDADSNNAGGYLVNCQWDFDYQRGHFSAESGYVLGRIELKGKEAKAAGRKYEAKLDAEYTFPAAGPRTVACRVQDNLGAETVKTVTIEVS